MSARHAAAPVSTDPPTRRFRHQAPPGLGLADGRFGRRLDRDPRTARQSPFCPTFPGFGTSERLCRWQQALLATAAAGNRGDDCTIKPRPSLVAQYQLTNLDE